MKLLFMRNALILSVPFVFCGCSLKAQTDAFKPQIDPSYTVEAHMEYADNAADVTVTRYSAGVWDAEFSAPAALAGVLLRFDGNAVSASYQGLQFSVPKSAMPAKTMLIAVTDVLDSFEGMEALPCTEQEDGTWQNAGTHDAGHYTVTFDPTGTIADMEFPDQPLKMTFRNYHCTAAQTTAPAGTAFTSAVNTQTAAVSSASSAKS